MNSGDTTPSEGPKASDWPLEISFGKKWHRGKAMCVGAGVRFSPDLLFSSSGGNNCYLVICHV